LISDQNLQYKFPIEQFQNSISFSQLER